MIKRLRIQNFRSLVDVTVDLDPLTVLIGRSGTGKSNFVSAIRFLRDSLAARQMNANSLGGPSRILHVDHQKEPLGYNLQFFITGLEESFEYGLQFDFTKGRVHEEYLKLGDTLLFHQAAGKWVQPQSGKYVYLEHEGSLELLAELEKGLE